jgi:hypothetical protein
MPYLNQRWPPEDFPEGDWVPEIDRPGWIARHSNLPHASWVKREGLTPDDVTHFRSLPSPSTSPQYDERLKYLEALGADIGSVQRDGYFYGNFLEQLKQAAPQSVGDSAADEAADTVVERMKAMGFTTANLPEHYGGPPERKSLRPWKAVMNWLSGLLHKVGRFLTNSIRAFAVLARGLFVGAVNQMSVSFSASIPPAIGFDIQLAYFTDDSQWDMFNRFTDAILTEIEKLVEP